MSNLGGRLQEAEKFSLSANGNLDNLGRLFDEWYSARAVHTFAFFLYIFKCFTHLKSRFRLKNPILPIKKILFLLLRRKAIMLQHLIIQFSFYYLSSGILRESKCERQSFALKVVAVAYERWFLTTGSKYSDSTWNLLVF